MQSALEVELRDKIAELQAELHLRDRLLEDFRSKVEKLENEKHRNDKLMDKILADKNATIAELAYQIAFYRGEYHKNDIERSERDTKK